jgi:hypothetical protein
MKRFLILFAALLALRTVAQPTNVPAPTPTLSFQAQAAARQSPATLKEVKPNEIVSGKVTYSGITIEAIKTGRPFQLLNPVAPAQYGSPEDNLVRNPINNRIVGLKFFAVRF